MTDTIEAVARAIYIADTHDQNDNTKPKLDLSGVDLDRWYDENAAMPLSGPGFVRRFHAQAQAAITTHTKALIEGAGELERFEDSMDAFREPTMDPDPDGSWVRYDQAAAAIAAMKAEIERLTEREAQAKLDGVRAGIEAAREAIGLCVYDDSPYDMIDDIDAEAIAKGIITADALSDLIAGDADLIDGGK